MSRLHLLTLAPSYSNKSVKNKSTNDYLKTEEGHQIIDDWIDCLRVIQCTSHDETMKTAKQFIQVDTFAKRTYQTLEKTRNALDLLLDKKLDMLSTVPILSETHQTLV